MVSLDGASLTPAQIASVADQGGRVAVTAQARARVASSHDFAVEVTSQRAVYGRTTGVGANRGETVSGSGEHAMALLRSHATSAGEVRSPDRVRAMLVVRLNQLAAGGSGVSLAVFDALAAMLDADALPSIREFGSIGTGDLPALATTALALAGEAPTSRPLPATVAIGAHDALPMLSSNAATIGDAALALVAIRRAADAATVIAALTFAAVDGNAEAFAESVDLVTPFAGTRRVLQQLRSLLPTTPPPARVQDPFALRTFPQVHGAFIDALGRLDEVVVAMANAPSENPVMLPEAGVAHHGGFHAAYLAQALDSVRSALAQSAQLTFARIGMLNEPALTTLPAFLTDATPGASGVMVVEYVAASALAQLRALAAPAAVQSATLSRGVENDASFASLAATQALAVAHTYRTLLACELLVAVRGVRMRGLTFAADSAIAAAVASCADLDASVADRDLTADLAIAERLLDALPDPDVTAAEGRESLK